MTATDTLRSRPVGPKVPAPPRPYSWRRLSRAGRYVVMAAFALAFLGPLLWMLGTSLRPEADVARNPLAFVPTTLSPQNYTDAFSTVLPFFLNSVKLAVFSVVGVLVVASLAGYAFARMEFRGKSVLFGVVLATSIVPQIVYLLPQYAFFQQLNWIDTQYPLWIPRALTPVFGTFLLRQAFRTLPKELEDAARLDGCSTFQIFWRVMLPQVKPALATVAVFTFVESWNDLFGPLIFINSTELQTLPLALSLFQGEFFTTISTLMAASTITILPVLVVYAFAQRYFVEGIASSGLKG
jgi:multiple sugar transport system permease protein